MLLDGGARRRVARGVRLRLGIGARRSFPYEIAIGESSCGSQTAIVRGGHSDKKISHLTSMARFAPKCQNGH
jgi:hypothetical protein